MNWKMINPDNLNLKQAFRNIIALLMLAVVLLVGCQGQAIFDTVFPPEESAEEVPEMTPEEVETFFPTLQIMPTQPENFNLVIWVPPQFDPNAETDSAKIFSARIMNFLQENPGVNLDVRIKAASGPGSILDTLTNAVGVAPEALPSLVLISRADLVRAVGKNLVYPIEGASTAIDESDWYSFAQEMGILQGTAFGLPFSSNIFGLVYRGEEFVSDTPQWDKVYKEIGSLLFPAGDPDAALTTALYLSAGGVLQNQQGQPTLDPEILTEVLRVYVEGARKGILQAVSAELQTDEQAWEIFSTTEVEAIVTWANRMTDINMTLNLSPLPVLGDELYTFARGWVWCLTEPTEINQPISASLAEYLVAPEFLAQWAPSSGYLPVRPSSISGWAETGIQDTLSSMLLSAHLQPINPGMESIYAEIKTAVIEVAAGQSSPEESAEKALQRLEAVETQ